MHTPNSSSSTLRAEAARDSSELPPLPNPDPAWRNYSAAPTIDWRRYSQLGWFTGKLLWHIFWWDVILRLPILRRLRQARNAQRLLSLQRLASTYCTLATDMGGVPVKLGQFLSLRFDLLPPEVTRTLAMLQDQVPPAPLAAILDIIEMDLQQPITASFAWFAPQPVASASLAQVHLARLPSGEQVVVKILHPGITGQVEMDLAAIGTLVRMLKRFRYFREQINLDLLLTEFSTVTRRELDLRAEGKHAERFARNFAGDAHVYIPRVYWNYSGTHTLTLEDVSYFRINEPAVLEAAGIQRAEVAKQLAQLYLKQIFVDYFFHADPHPGNLFIKPLPHPAENRLTDFAPGEPVPDRPDRPFQIVLIDFGMATEIPESARRWLREFVIGLGLRDAHRIVQSYVTGGILFPNVDLERLEEMTADLLKYFPESLVAGLLPNLDQPETQLFWAKYQDLFKTYTFQIPINLLFMYRGLNIMGSLAKQLDPTFDVIAAAAPFAAQLLWQNVQTEWQDWLQELAGLGRLLLTSPLPVDQLLTQVQVVRNVPAPFQQLFSPSESSRSTPPTLRLAPQDRQTIQHLTKSLDRLITTVMVIGILLIFVLWHVDWPSQSLVDSLTSHPGGWGPLFVLAPLLLILRRLLFK